MADLHSLARSLAGKAAIVTGASQAIGAAMAEALARRGAAVVAAHWGEPEGADQVVERIRAAGGSALAHEADLSDAQAGREMVARTVGEFGGLDIYAANAGLTFWAPFLEYAEADWDRVMNLNLRGSFFSAQAAAQQMVRQGTGGAIVFSSSVTGLRAVRSGSAYGISKAALNHMARCLALELGPHRISVNALGIGATLNERNLRDDPDYEAHWSRVTPSGRPALPVDIARGLLYFIDNPFITGATLVIDGGWTVQSPTPDFDMIDRAQSE